MFSQYLILSHDLLYPRPGRYPRTPRLCLSARSAPLLAPTTLVPHREHFDLVENRHRRALQLGAGLVTIQELVEVELEKRKALQEAQEADSLLDLSDTEPFEMGYDGDL